MAGSHHRIDAAGEAGERAALEAFLDDYRDTIVRKASGASEEDARRRLVPSLTTVGGVVKHLRWTEQGWFQLTLAQRRRSELPTLPGADDDPDVDFRLEPGETLAGLVEEYREECERSRETAARYPLEHAVPDAPYGMASLRWIYLHMIEETARHAGHLDILREQIDGTVGD